MLTSVTKSSMWELLLHLNTNSIKNVVSIVPAKDDATAVHKYGYTAVYWAPILEDIIESLRSGSKPDSEADVSNAK